MGRALTVPLHVGLHRPFVPLIKSKSQEPCPPEEVPDDP
jgi:hypothetical protein